MILLRRERDDEKVRLEFRYNCEYVQHSFLSYAPTISVKNALIDTITLTFDLSTSKPCPLQANPKSFPIQSLKIVIVIINLYSTQSRSLICTKVWSS